MVVSSGCWCDPFVSTSHVEDVVRDLYRNRFVRSQEHWKPLPFCLLFWLEGQVKTLCFSRKHAIKGVMGNMVTAVHDVACSHTNHTSLWRSLLPDRLAKPTAEMVEAWLYLQDQTLQLKELGESDLERCVAVWRHHTVALLGQRLLCSLRQAGRGDRESRVTLLSEFSCALRKPDDFLDNLLKWRAQALPTKQVAKLKPLSHLAGGLPGTFRGRFAETLSQLAVYLRASCECAEIYAEIRELLAAGEMKPQEAEVWLFP